MTVPVPKLETMFTNFYGSWRRHEITPQIRVIFWLACLRSDSGDPPVSPELVEIIALRLMLTNLLKPLTTGQKITPEVSDGTIAEVKKQAQPGDQDADRLGESVMATMHWGRKETIIFPPSQRRQ
jgi:hypothetical protein